MYLFKKCQIFSKKNTPLKIFSFLLFLSCNIQSEDSQAEVFKRSIKICESTLKLLKNNSLIKNEYLKKAVNQGNSSLKNTLSSFIKAKAMQKILTSSQPDLEIENSISIDIINNQEEIEQFIKFCIYPEPQESKIKKYILPPLVAITIGIGATFYKKFIHDKNTENLLKKIDKNHEQKNKNLQNDLEETTTQINKTLNKKIVNLEKNIQEKQERNVDAKYEKAVSKFLLETNDLKSQINKLEEKVNISHQENVHLLQGIYQAQGLGEKNQKKIDGLENTVLTLGGQIDSFEKMLSEKIRELRLNFEKLQNEVKEPQATNFLDQPYLVEKINEIKSMVEAVDTKTNERINKLRDITKEINNELEQQKTKITRTKNNNSSKSGVAEKHWRL